MPYWYLISRPQSAWKKCQRRRRRIFRQMTKSFQNIENLVKTHKYKNPAKLIWKMEAPSYPSQEGVVYNPIPKPEPDPEYQRIKDERRRRRNILICVWISAIVFFAIIIPGIFLLVVFLVLYAWSFWTRLLEINMSSLFYSFLSLWPGIRMIYNVIHCIWEKMPGKISSLIILVFFYIT